MDHQANNPEHVAAAAGNNPASTIDFHSVIDLNAYANKPVKLDIDSSVTERPGAGKGGSELVTANENVRLTENGHALPEHVLNNLILTEHGHNVHLNDNTVVVAGGPGQHKGHGEAGGYRYGMVREGETDHNIAKSGPESAKEKSGHAAVLPNLSIENEKK